MLEVVSRPYLGDILDRSQNGSHDSEEIGPESEVGRQGNIEDAGYNDNDQAVQHAEESNNDCGLPSGRVASKLLGGDIGILIPEEDEKEHETRRKLASYPWQGKGFLT